MAIASRAGTAGGRRFSRGQQRDVHPAARPAQQAEEHHVEQHYRQDTHQTVARVIAKANGLVIERRERIGDIQPPQDGEGHPAAA